MHYNPDYHSAVVSNYRSAFKAKYNKDCTLTDERIWYISGEFVGLEGGIEAEDEAILEQMNEEQPTQP